jgi:nucleoid DNA-binding protein
MIPRKRRELTAELAPTLGVPAELLDDVVSFYFKSVQEKLSSLDFLQVAVPELGTFQVKGKALKGKILKTNGLLKKFGLSSTPQATAICAEKQAELTALEQLLAAYEQQAVQRQTIRQLRYEKPAENLG